MTDQPGPPTGPQWGPPPGGQPPYGPPGGQPPYGPPGGQPPKKRKKWPFVAGGVLLLIIIIGIATSNSGDSKSTAAVATTTAAPTTTAAAAPTAQPTAATPTTTQAPAPTKTQAPASTTQAPAAPASLSSDSGWTLVSFQSKESLGTFGGTARVTNATGKDVQGVILKVTLLEGNDVVATLNGAGAQVPDGKTVTIQLISSDKYRKGNFTPQLQIDATY